MLYEERLIILLHQEGFLPCGHVSHEDRIVAKDPVGLLLSHEGLIVDALSSTGLVLVHHGGPFKFLFREEALVLHSLRLDVNLCALRADIRSNGALRHLVLVDRHLGDALHHFELRLLDLSF